MNTNLFKYVSRECNVALEVSQSRFSGKLLSLSMCMASKNIGLLKTLHLFYYLQISNSTEVHGQHSGV